MRTLPTSRLPSLALAAALSTVLLPAALVGGLAGCVDADTDAPPAPRFDLGGAARSRVAKLTLAGTAEYGVALELTREPAFEASATPAAQTADPFSARFSYADVPLMAGENTFTLVATDAAGNKGAPAKLVVTYDDTPLALELGLSAPMMVAGATGPEGELVATARVLGGVEGFKLDGREVEFALSGVGTETKTGTTDAYGRATATFSGLKSVGVGTVVAKTKGANGLSDAASFVVTAGAPATLTLALRKAGTTDAAAAAVSVGAGDEVSAEVSVKDGGANRVDAPVQLFTDAPGALVSGLTVRKLQRVGTWRVVAAVSGVATAGGVAVSAAGTIEVRAGAAAKLVFNAPSSAVAGEAFPWSFALTDAFDNVVDAPAGASPSLTSATDPGLTVDAAGKLATLTKAGAQALSATLAGGPSATVSVAVSAASPARLSFALDGADENTATADLEVRAGLDNAVSVKDLKVLDRFQNPVVAPVVLTTTAPAPAIFDGVSVRGVTRAGTWAVAAAVPGTLLFARKTFGVLGQAGSALALELASGAATAGVPVGCSAKVVDPFGNETTEPVAISVDGLAAADYVVDDVNKTLSVAKASATALTVRARPGSAGSSIAAATAPLLVSAGAPATVAVDTGGPSTFAAGSTPPFNVVVTDALGNQVTNPPLSLAVVPTGATVAEPPGPVVSAGRIYNLVRPGTYLLVAQVTGTSLTNPAADPRATITVTAADASSVDLVLTRGVAEVGSPVDFKLFVRDAYGNVAAGTPAVAVMQGATSVAPAIAGTSWTATAAGSYTLTATLTSGSRTLSDSEPLTITDATDATGPTVAFTNPANDPTIPAWPPAGATSPAGCPGAGDVAAVTAADASLVGNVWASTAGQVAAPTLTSPAGFPASPQAVTVDVCTTGAGSPARGEVLVTVAAADLKGNYRTATGSWCVDPDATAYAPANVPYQRCVLVKQAASASRAFGLAASDSGELAVARESDNGDAYVHLFKRTSAYGLGTGHALTGYASPRGVALTGSTAFTAVASITKAAIVRTRSLDKAGGGTDDAFVAVDSTDRFDGVALSQDGSLYATTNARVATTFGTKLWKFDRPLDVTAQYSALPATPVAASSSLRLTSLCRGPRAAELYGTGYVLSGTKTLAVVVKATLATGALTTLYTDATDGRKVGGCAVTNAGIAVAFSKDSGAGVVTVVDPVAGTAATTPLMSGYTSAFPLDRPSGVAVADGYLFAVSSEGTASSLVRFARAGGF